jgi:putative tryptophan/tyrosine transport system substrate-binding protein
VPEAPLLLTRRAEIAELAISVRLPAIYTFREYVQSGGLMSYGSDLPDLYRRAAPYVDKILKGAKPGELPLQTAEKFELAVNLKTAKALGLTISEAFLVRAERRDRVSLGHEDCCNCSRPVLARLGRLYRLR